MAVTYTCDGCGKTAPAAYSDRGDPLKPWTWYQRSDDDGAQHACSRECIDRIANKTGKTNVVLPI